MPEITPNLFWYKYFREWNLYYSKLVKNRLTACLFQQLLGQASVTLAPSLMRLLAGRISSDRLVPRTKIPSAQLIVVPQSENTRTSLGRSRMALFEGAFNAQVKKSHLFKEAAKCLKSLTWILFLISSFVICVNLLPHNHPCSSTFYFYFFGQFIFLFL